MAKTVLVINSGSSSIKYQLVNLESGEGLASGLVEKIGEPTDGAYTHKFNGEKHTFTEPIKDHEQGLKKVLSFFDQYGPNLKDYDLVAVGHRVVQGGYIFPTPALVTPKTIQQVKDLAVLAPLHNGPEAIGAEVMTRLLPDVPQGFVFDSSFFFQLPAASSTYALNKEVAEKYHIRRYGAHGTSHEYVGSVVPQLVDKPAEGLKQIVLHIGNGASASAQISGRPVETSMGLTPLEGLVMGGRTGDIDPAVVFHLIRNAHMDVDQLDTLFNKQSGMMGLTGHGDMRDVDALRAQGDKDAQLAFDIYIHRIVSYIGAYTAQMSGVDVITFTAGVGENDSSVRQAVCDKLAPFGVRLDKEKNEIRSSQPRIISTPDSSVIIAVIPTNEELAIARKVAQLAEVGDEYGNKFQR
ncbi:acetate kinase [Scardovia inopinata]|uniref:Acetate kinase n=1 Tax=Scardovia inopinata F0304 TaxID=641146 RepID=W5IJG8_SCAIO|nr:acetate kinase [Scardovia inopinata]EFG27011.2 acetate kinase [Scardovia inopinata F0304]BAR06621.1 acetate kinase [Scardovia inopinata JCM 12537]SUV52152.1 acetate kinase [Scardovia inopinata]